MALAVATIAQPVVAGGPVPLGAFRLSEPLRVPLAREVRVRLALAPVQPSWRFDLMDGIARRGVGGALIDLFPFDDYFHLSAGGRLFSRAAARSSGPDSLQLMPSAPAAGLRPGRRFSPAMLMGYSRTTREGVSLGLDAGMLVGQTDPAPEFRIGRSGGLRAPAGLNGLARMTMHYRF